MDCTTLDTCADVVTGDCLANDDPDVHVVVVKFIDMVAVVAVVEVVVVEAVSNPDNCAVFDLTAISFSESISSISNDFLTFSGTSGSSLL